MLNLLFFIIIIIIASKDKNELWRIAKEITNPRNANDWNLKDDTGLITGEQVIADTFNEYFTNIRKFFYFSVFHCKRPSGTKGRRDY